MSIQQPQIAIMTPEQITALVQQVVTHSQKSTLPPEAQELEILKRMATLTPEEVEKLYGIKIGTLANMRINGRGPEFIQEAKGCQVFYEHESIREYLRKCRKRTYKT